MIEYKYTFNHYFLDTVFKIMYQTRGTYQTTFNIVDEVEKIIDGRAHYNDVLMCLDQMLKDGYVTHEGLSKEKVPIYRLSYQGYLAFNQATNGTPYGNLITIESRKKRASRWKNVLIAINAIAILLITGSQVYFDKKDSQRENQIRSLEQKIDDLVKENTELENRRQRTTQDIKHSGDTLK